MKFQVHVKIHFVSNLIVLIFLSINLSQVQHVSSKWFNPFQLSSKAASQDKKTDKITVTKPPNIALEESYDENQNLSPLELKKIISSISSYPNKNLLIGWPTIPVLYKGADSRAIHAVHFLSTKLNFNVDLVYWRSFKTEANETQYNEENDLLRLKEAGIRNIYGPFDGYNSTKEDEIDFAMYYSFIFWLWPDAPYLHVLINLVNTIKRHNSLTKVVAAVDDIGVSVRNLFASCNNHSRTVEEVENFLLQRKKHPDLIGIDVFENDFDNETMEESEFNFVTSPTYLFHLEMYLYVMADLTLGINNHTSRFLSRLAPGTPNRLLRYVSPKQPAKEEYENHPFHKRRDYIFYGYNNPANYNALDWFQREVLPHISQDQKLHVAGRVCAYPCACQSSPGLPVSSYHKNVVCHGTLGEEELDFLISSSRAAINPIIEPSGVSTKTCRAMALGTPVVVTELDGTFSDSDETSKTSGAKRCPEGDVLCIAHSLNLLLMNEQAWKEASDAALQFIPSHYGYGAYMRDWLQILYTLSPNGDESVERITEPSVEILLVGNAKLYSDIVDEYINWNIVKILQSIPEFHVTVLGFVDPQIHGVSSLVQHHQNDTYFIVGTEYNGGLPKTYKAQKSPFITGYQPNLLLKREKSELHGMLPLNFCGPGCRVLHLPSNYAAFQLEHGLENVDWILSSSSVANESLKSISMPYPPINCDNIKATPFDNSELSDAAQINYVFIGDFTPLSGIDILLLEFEKTFCYKNILIQLTLYTTTVEPFGFNSKEILKMNKILESCKSNIKHSKLQGTAGSQEHALEILQSHHVFIAPLRTGNDETIIPILQSYLLGLSVIFPLGAIPMLDSLVSPDTASLYPIHAESVICEHPYLCPLKSSVCIFEPCMKQSSLLSIFTSSHNTTQCTCKSLLNNKTPKWLNVNRDSLRQKIKDAYKDEIQRRKSTKLRDPVMGDRVSSTFCSSSQTLQTIYKDEVYRILIHQSNIPRNLSLLSLVRPGEEVKVDEKNVPQRKSSIFSKIFFILAVCIVVLNVLKLVSRAGNSKRPRGKRWKGNSKANNENGVSHKLNVSGITILSNATTKKHEHQL